MVAKYTLILTSVLVGGAAAQGGAFTMNYNGADRKTDGKWSHRTGDQYDLTADPRKDMIMTCGEVKIYAGGISDDVSVWIGVYEVQFRLIAATYDLVYRRSRWRPIRKNTIVQTLPSRTGPTRIYVKKDGTAYPG